MVWADLSAHGGKVRECGSERDGRLELKVKLKSERSSWGKSPVGNWNCWLELVSFGKSVHIHQVPHVQFTVGVGPFEDCSYHEIAEFKILLVDSGGRGMEGGKC